MHTKLQEPKYSQSQRTNGPGDRPDESLGSVYRTIPLFLIAEYFVELSYERIPAGLVFPFGFFVFWACYYSYYRPNSLEAALSDPSQWTLGALPGLFLSTMIWLVKVSSVGLLFWIFRKATQSTAADARLAPGSLNTDSQAGRHTERRRNSIDRTAFSQGVLSALGELGLNRSASWRDVHKRYRQLAVALHPDMHGRLIQTRVDMFISVDRAYRRLESMKHSFRP